MFDVHLYLSTVAKCVGVRVTGGVNGSASGVQEYDPGFTCHTCQVASGARWRYFSAKHVGLVRDDWTFPSIMMGGEGDGPEHGSNAHAKNCSAGEEESSFCFGHLVLSFEFDGLHIIGAGSRLPANISLPIKNNS